MKHKHFILTTLFFQLAFVHVFALAGKYESTIRNFWMAVDKGQFDVAIQSLNKDLKVFLPLSPEPLNREAYRQLGENFRLGFPDIRHEVVECTEGKWTAAVRGVFSGTNTGVLMGNPPTGNRVEIPFIQYWTFDQSGKAIRIDMAFDQTAFNAQLMKGIADPNTVAEENIRELYRQMDAGQTHNFAKYCAPEFRVTNPFLPSPSPLQAFIGVIQTQKTAFPDMEHEIHDIISEGKFVVSKGIFRGTNTGNMMGNPPTGNRVELPFLVCDEVNDKGQILNRNVQFDSKSFEMQLMKGISEPANKATELANQFFATPGTKDALKRLNTLLAPDFRSVHFPGPGGSGKEEYINGIFRFLEAFPDMKITILKQSNEGNQVFTYGFWEGKHQADFMGIPATGKNVHVEFMDIWTEKDGQLILNEVVMDIAGLMAQLGVIGGNNKAIAAEMMMALEKQNLDGVLVHCSPSARFNGWGPQPLDAKGYRQAMSDILKSFPDARFKVNSIIAEGDLVVVQHQLEGTHTGAAFNGIPTSKKKVLVPASATFRFKDGKAEELWLNADMLGMLMQLGVNPLAKN